MSPSSLDLFRSYFYPEAFNLEPSSCDEPSNQALDLNHLNEVSLSKGLAFKEDLDIRDPHLLLDLHSVSVCEVDPIPSLILLY